jgi:selenocysteine lyase/cysteine desulfurase
LYIGPEAESQLSPIRQGGTGTDSAQARQPVGMPERYESGNHNVPGILGLGAGVTYLEQRTIQSIRQHDQRLTSMLSEGLREIDAVRLYGPTDEQQRVGVISISIADADPQEFAMMLDVTHRVQVRAGLHCAPRMHEALGTASHGGTIRFSLGVFNTEDDIQLTLQAVRELTTEK